jgi:site-specific DNA recombinase
MQNRTDETADAPVRRSLRYLRVSSKKQMDTDADIDPDGNSIDTQRKVCQVRERELGFVNVDEYVEPGNSAQTIEKRPVFQENAQAHRA